MINVQWIQKMMVFMNGRYGFDEFSKFLVFIGLVFSLLSNFIGGTVVSAVGFAFVVFAGLRVLSKEKNNRLKELQRYIKIKQRIVTRYYKIKNSWTQRKVYKYTKCPECKQKVRVPKGKNKIRITCPSCQNKFIKKT